MTRCQPSRARKRLSQVIHKISFHESFFNAILISVQYRARKILFVLLIKCQKHDLIANWCIRSIKKAKFDKRKNSYESICLAICPERFRGDLEVLETTGKCLIYRLPTDVIYFLNSIFLVNREDPGGNYNKTDYLHPSKRGEFVSQRDNVLRLYEKIVPIITADLGIELVLMPNFTMPHFEDFAIVAKESGIAFVVLHREGLMAAEGAIERDYLWSKWAGRFKGTGLIVHSDLQRDALIRSQFAKPAEVVAAGCLRMDSYIVRLGTLGLIGAGPHTCSPNRSKNIVLFSFSPGTGLVGMQGFEHVSNFPLDRKTGFWNLFVEVHRVFVRLATMFPQSNFIIKTKWGKTWFDEIDKAIEGVVGGQFPANLKITDRGDPQDLIIAADIVTSFGSTTLLEAAIAGKHVILPMFAEAKEDKYEKFVFFRDEPSVFDVAKSAGEYSKKLTDGLKSNNCNKLSNFKERLELFKKYLSSPDGDATKDYLINLKQFVEVEKESHNKRLAEKLEHRE
jgi:hypothetical protein